MSDKTIDARTWAAGALAVLLLGACIWLGVQQVRLSTENGILRQDIATLHGRVGELETSVMRLQADNLRPAPVAAARAARVRPDAAREAGASKAPRGRKARPAGEAPARTGKARRKAPANPR